MPNTDSVVELRGLLAQDSEAQWISNLWVKWNNQRAGAISQWQEVDEYIYSTDTTTTSNSQLPWTHTARNPKLTQIRDNLHSNYISSLFPNDKWLTWVAYTTEAAKKDVAETLTSYMENKTREGKFRDTVSALLYDYIDRGVAFAMPDFETRYNTESLERTPSFVGPKAVRINPNDIVFDPTVSDFRYTPKIIRSLTTVGRLKKLAITHPDQKFWEQALDRRKALSQSTHAGSATYSVEDWEKASMYSIDGFGNLQEYYGSNSVEVLDFYGDIHDPETGELKQSRMITVVDRSIVVRDIEIPTYSGEANISMVGWRKRPNNLWAQGPLANLVGMQYQIDHYMNMAANALDLKVMPPKKIIGNVEEFSWGPNVEIHIDENGDVEEMAQKFGDITACLNFIEQLEYRMEMYAGAPREAMGIRTPGEKTAFEVQALENAAGRIFQEKIIQFELFLEELLNDMLETAHRHMDFVDIIRVIDKDIGVQDFRQISKEDIVANGILRPIGARHFAQKAQELQNLVGVFNSPMAQIIAPHTSGVGLADFINDVVNLRGYTIFKTNIAVEEQQELEMLSQQAQEDNISKDMIIPEEFEEEAMSMPNEE